MNENTHDDVGNLHDDVGNLHDDVGNLHLHDDVTRMTMWGDTHDDVG